MKNNKYIALVLCGLSLNVMALEGEASSKENLPGSMVLELDNVLFDTFEIKENSFLSEVIEDISKKSGYKVIWRTNGDFLINNKVVFEEMSFLGTLDVIGIQFVNNIEIKVYTKNKVVVVSDA